MAERFLWALDTVLLGMVLSTLVPDESFRSAVWIVPLVSAWFHDLFSTCWLFLLTLLSGKLGQLKKPAVPDMALSSLLPQCWEGRSA